MTGSVLAALLSAITSRIIATSRTVASSSACMAAVMFELTSVWITSSLEFVSAAAALLRHARLGSLCGFGGLSSYGVLAGVVALLLR